MKVVELIYDYHICGGDEEYRIANLQKYSDKWVVEIREHLPQGEGDRLYYDIIYNDNTMIRTFNPNKVKYV